MDRRSALRWIAGAVLSLWMGRLQGILDEDGWTIHEGSPIEMLDAAISELYKLTGGPPNTILISRADYIAWGGDPDAIEVE